MSRIVETNSKVDALLEELKKLSFEEKASFDRAWRDHLTNFYVIGRLPKL